MKRILALFITLLFIPVLTVQASETQEYLKNNSFEEVTSETPDEWKSGNFGKEITLTTEKVKEGERAISVVTESPIIMYQVVKVKGEQNFTLSGFVYRKDGPKTIFATKIEYTGIDGKPLSAGNTHVVHKTDAAKRWTKFTYDFKTPVNAASATILLRIMEPGTVFLDNISLIGPVRSEEDNKPVDIGGLKLEEPIQNILFAEQGDAPELLTNRDFEICEDNTFENWMASKPALISVEEVGERGKTLRIDDYGNDSLSNPFVQQKIPAIPGATYQISAWVRNATVTGIPEIKVEFYNEEGAYIAPSSARFLPTNGYWQRVGLQFEVPATTAYMMVLVRLIGEGILNYDDASLFMVRNAHVMNCRSDVFCYSDWDCANAYAEINEAVMPIADGSRILFSLRDGETVLDTYETKAMPVTTYSFDVSLLKEKEKEYIVAISYLAPDGTLLAEGTDKVYRYDRPARLLPDGRFLGKGDKPITPIFGYHVDKNLESYKKCAEGGINVIQCGRLGKDVEGLIEMLDIAEEAGVYLALALYTDMKPAGNEYNREATIALINAVKDHPALFGYMTMDEPLAGGLARYEDMKESYRLVRSLDPKHPVFVVECTQAFTYYSWTTCDAFSVDPYPSRTSWVGHVANFTAETMKSVGTDKKPVYNILQTCTIGSWLPTGEDVRHMMYEAYFTDQTSIGYYAVQEDYANPPRREIMWNNEAQWAQIEAIGTYENEEAFKAFKTGEYPTYLHQSASGTPVWYKLYIKDGKLRGLFMNMTSEEQTLSLPLSAYGITVSAFSATAADTSGAAPISGGDTLSLTLAPTQTILYEFETGVDFSEFKANAYIDLDTHTWATESINLLHEKKVIDDSASRKFRPQEAITRGDFAAMLIRTLGLTAEGKNTFVDVPSGASYAKEIAIGSALGILNGVGNGKFDPEAPITRQDLMVICARGLRHKGDFGGDATVLQKYPDSSIVADYAAADVAAMTTAEIVRGNADGTLNPLGNATRAETAVIMFRILSRKSA